MWNNSSKKRYRSFFTISLFMICCLKVNSRVYSLEEKPKYNDQVVGRFYRDSEISYHIINAPCQNQYKEISLENQIPKAKGIQGLEYVTTKEEVFKHPLIKEYKPILHISWDSHNEWKKDYIKIPLNIPIPSFARSFGIIVGGDGFSTNTIEIVIDKNGKEHHYSLNKILLKGFYRQYTLPLNSYFKSSLKEILIKGSIPSNRELLSNIKKKNIFLGPISFYPFSVSPPYKEGETLEKIETPLSFLETPLPNTEPLGKYYEVTPEGLWYKDDLLFLDFQDLKPGWLEFTARLQDRLNKVFIGRIFVSGSKIQDIESHTCVEISLPQDIKNYEVKSSGGSYFGIMAIKWTRAESNKEGTTKLSKAFLLRKNGETLTYPLDKE